MICGGIPQVQFGNIKSELWFCIFTYSAVGYFF